MHTNKMKIEKSDTFYKELKMEQLKFRERIDGLMIDCIYRDSEYSMAVKHMHDEYEMYVLLEGEQYYFIEEKTCHVTAGTIVLIGKEKIHWTGKAGCDRQERIVVEIKEEWLEPFLKKNGFWSLNQLFHTYQMITPKEEDFKEICRLLLEVKEELAQKRLCYEMNVKMKLTQLFLVILRCGKDVHKEKRTEEKSSETYHIVRGAVRYIQSNCERKLLIQEVADALFVSRCYLNRIFKEYIGVTVNEYIVIQRIQKGKKLLQQEGHSITKISELAGFESVTYFGKVFKQYTGKTPRMYRSQFQSIKGKKTKERELEDEIQ